MSLRIGHSAETVAVHRNLRMSTDKLAVSMRRLSSGLRINTAADDAAGLGISEKMRGQIRGLEQAGRNIQDGISLLNTAEAALETVHTILQRARELAVQYNNGTNSLEARAAIAAELIQLSDEVSRIEGTTNFNGVPLLQSSLATITLQVGANDGEVIAVTLTDLFGVGLSLVRPITFFTPPFVDADIAGFDAHIADVANARGRFGAYVNRLEHALAANAASQEAYMGSESRLRDLDMAQEMTQLARQKVLQQSTMAMLAQAQSGPSARARMNELLAP